jgi:hypothetical protein
MLNTPGAAFFFENCLVESGLVDGRFKRISLAEVKADTGQRQALKRALRDIQTGADTILARGKPAEETLGLSPQEWEYRWSAWAASRKAAFYARAALLMLGETELLPYFLHTLKTSPNIVFKSAASDLLQYTTGHILEGPEEDLSGRQLAAWWNQKLDRREITFKPVVNA